MAGCKRCGLLEAVWQDLRLAIRMLRKHPVLTASLERRLRELSTN